MGINVDHEQSLFFLKISEGVWYRAYVSIQAAKPRAGSFADASANETKAVSLFTCTGTYKTPFQ